jgi:methylated-DNA-protein-cysteine methyltransferase related protein
VKEPPTPDRPTIEQLWREVRRIPPGRCTTYGLLGASLDPPASGRQVGRWMANAPADVPWWRVVARTGLLPIGKRGPEWAREQLRLLAAEAVPVDPQGQVKLQEVLWEPEGELTGPSERARRARKKPASLAGQKHRYFLDVRRKDAIE